MTTQRTAPRLTLARDESGGTAIFMALTLVVLCGLMALAFDIGHIFMVRSELQRTADAAALAGAAGLSPYTELSPVPTPYWAIGVRNAHTLIHNPGNKTDNVQFSTTDGTVDYGYWYLKPATGYVQPPSSGLPKARPTDAAHWPEPAVTVTLSRNVTLSFAPVVGVSNPRTVRATATAILPEAYITSNLPPIAVSWDTVYDNIGGSVVIDSDEQGIKIQANKGVGGWFNQIGDNSVPSVRIDAPLDITKNIYLVPGTKATLTDFMTAGQTVVIPVVQNVSQNTWSPVIGFGAFVIDSLSSNTMTGHFINQYFDPKVIYDPNVVPPAVPNLFGGVSGTPKLIVP
jgi:Flp pilus assembly protein TadG